MKKSLLMAICALILTSASFLRAQDLQVVAMTPENQATSVPDHATIAVTFNKEIKEMALGIEIDRIILLMPSPLDISNLSVSGNVLSIDVELAADQSYQVVLSGELLRGKDGSGLGMIWTICGIITTGEALPAASVSGRLSSFYPLDQASGYVVLFAQQITEKPYRISEVDLSTGAYGMSNIEPGMYTLMGRQYSDISMQPIFQSIFPEQIMIEAGESLADFDISIASLEIVSSTPAANALNVDTTFTVSITFNKAIQYDYWDGGYILDLEILPAPKYLGTMTSSKDGKTVFFRVNLAQNTVYTMSISSARGEDNSYFVEPVQFTFYTGGTLPTAKITGTITNKNLAGDRDILVGLIDESGAPLALTNIDTDGTFAISNLKAGSYYVFAKAPMHAWEAERQATMTPDGLFISEQPLKYLSYYGWDGTGSDVPDAINLEDGQSVSGMDMVLSSSTVVKLLSHNPEDGKADISGGYTSISYTFNLPFYKKIRNEFDLENYFDYVLQMQIAPLGLDYNYPELTFSNFGRTVSLMVPADENTYYTTELVQAKDMLGSNLPSQSVTFVNPAAFGFSGSGEPPASRVSGTISMPGMSSIGYLSIFLIPEDASWIIEKTADKSALLKSMSRMIKHNRTAAREEDFIVIQALSLVDLTNGSYSVPVADGIYYPVLSGELDSTDIWKTYDPDGTGSAQSIEIMGESLSGIDFSLQGYGVAISGIVRNNNNRRVANAQIVIYGEDYLEFAESDIEGHFQIKNVPPGDYMIYVSAPIGANLLQKTLEVYIGARNVELNITLSGEGNHYSVTENTGANSIINIQNALIDEMPLEYGDEIAVLAPRPPQENILAGSNGGLKSNGMLVVGAAIFGGMYPLQIIAWKDNPSTEQKDGYAEGDSILFEFWNSQKNHAMSAVPAFEEGNGRFSTGDTISITEVSARRMSFNEIIERRITPGMPGTRVSFENNSAVHIQFQSEMGREAAVSIQAYNDVLPDDIRNQIQNGLSNVAGYYDITTEFPDTIAASLEIEYTESMLTAHGINENNLIMAFYDSLAGRWKAVPTEVDVINRIASVLTDHFSLWALADSTDEIISHVGDKIEADNIPGDFRLFNNYPNPFNPSTTIRYEIKYATFATLVIYNLLGQKIRTLVHQAVPGGIYDILWNGCSDSGVPVASGVYFYRIQAGTLVETKKMLLLR